MLIASNQSCSAWDSIFPDDMMAVAAIDRLVHHVRIPVKLDTESGTEPNSQSGQADHLSERRDAGV